MHHIDIERNPRGFFSYFQKMLPMFPVVLGGGLLFPGGASAFQVGSLNVLSEPGKPFQAQFAIFPEPGEKMADLHMGSQSDYRLLGLRYLDASANFHVALKGSGEQMRAVLTSATPPPRGNFDLVLTVSSDRQTRFPQFSVDWEKPSFASPASVQAAKPPPRHLPVANPVKPTTKNLDQEIEVVEVSTPVHSSQQGKRANVVEVSTPVRSSQQGKMANTAPPGDIPTLSHDSPPLHQVRETLKKALQDVTSLQTQLPHLATKFEETKSSLHQMESRLKKLEERSDAPIAPLAGSVTTLEKRVAQLEDSVGRPVRPDEEVAKDDPRQQRLDDLERRIKDLELTRTSRADRVPVMPKPASPDGVGEVRSGSSALPVKVTANPLHQEESSGFTTQEPAKIFMTWLDRLRHYGNTPWWIIGIVSALILLWRGYRSNRDLGGKISVRKRPSRPPRFRSSAAGRSEHKDLPRSVEPSFSSAAALYPPSDLDEAVGDVIIRKATVANEWPSGKT
ncbi:MAG: hypothetical protein HQL63_09875 [Magnetococcales bacterium]|nr:hypothetical protein [Magnetococcales bacterium]MBF0322975.1 hypothetical protein [Magnetococcales bacterium]